MINPLLADWDTPFNIAPFDKISDSDFAPALDLALNSQMEEISAIANKPNEPTFANTIDALQASGEYLSKVLSVFFAVSSADSNDSREALMLEFAPKLSAHNSEIIGNEKLFARIDTLWKNHEKLGLNEEQLRVLMLSHRKFLRGGAALEGPARKRMKEIQVRLSVLGTQFSQNLLADEREWFLKLDDLHAEGLPDFLIQAATSAAEEKGLGGMIITMSRSLIVPFLQFSSKRDLRELAYNAWAARGNNQGERDNKLLAREMLELRQEMAKLLGYENFASFRLEIEMAKTPSNALELLKKVWAPARIRAEQDADVLQALMHNDGVKGDLEKWDWRYYSEKLRRAQYDLDEAEVKPFFQLEEMIRAAFHCANRLFGLAFKDVDIPLYHEDCRAWEVTRDGQHVALFIGDYFARDSKRSGAWCSALRAQSKIPKPQAPVVVNVCNFAKSDPALLSYDDARTLFHEFGHALHQMLSNVNYELVSGTSVPRDFVELPSQLYEHWLGVPEVLREFAIHAETGVAIAPKMVGKILDSATYDMGFQTVEYIASAIVDLEFHKSVVPENIMEKESFILREIGMPKAIGMRHSTPHFAHVFSGGHYASAYYSYMWSEVMDEDAFAAFEEKRNSFDRDLANSLEENILSKGGSKDPEALYLAYRGRLPTVEALLKGRKLIA